MKEVRLKYIWFVIVNTSLLCFINNIWSLCLLLIDILYYNILLFIIDEGTLTLILFSLLVYACFMLPLIAYDNKFVFKIVLGIQIIFCISCLIIVLDSHSAKLW